MLLAIITILTAFLMEGIGSYMSVVGWASLLVGDWVVIALFIILDLAKIVTVSFLYQTWREINKSWRTYMTGAVLFLMVATSAGSFGYLSNTFQNAIQPNKEIAVKIQSETIERDQLIAEKKQLTESKTKIEDQIAKLPNDSVAGRTRLINNFREETRGINNKVKEVDKRLGELNKSILANQTSSISQDAHVGPMVYLANAFDIPIERLVSYAILSIIFVFDPLAVSLILAGNYLLKRRKEEKAVSPKIVEIISEPIVIPPAPEIKVDEEPMVPIVIEEALPVVEEPIKPIKKKKRRVMKKKTTVEVPKFMEPLVEVPVAKEKKPVKKRIKKEPVKEEVVSTPDTGNLNIGEDSKIQPILEFAENNPASAFVEGTIDESWKRNSPASKHYQ